MIEQESEIQDFGFTPTDEFANLRMEGYNVEFGKTLSEAWNFMKPYWGVLMSYTLFCFFADLTLSFAISLTTNMLGDLGYIAGAIVNLTVISALLAGFYSYYQKIYLKEKFSFHNLLDGFNLIGQLALHQIIVVIMIVLPFVGIFFLAQKLGVNRTVNIFDTNTYETFTLVYYFLFVIPSLLVFTLYIFTPLIIVVTRMSFWQAMEISRKLVLANYLGVFGFVLGFIFINLVGLLFFGVGTLLTIPLTFAATFLLYVRLLKANGRSTNFNGDFYNDENAPLDAF